MEVVSENPFQENLHGHFKEKKSLLSKIMPRFKHKKSSSTDADGMVVTFQYLICASRECQAFCIRRFYFTASVFMATVLFSILANGGCCYFADEESVASLPVTPKSQQDSFFSRSGVRRSWRKVTSHMASRKSNTKRPDSPERAGTHSDDSSGSAPSGGGRAVQVDAKTPFKGMEVVPSFVFPSVPSKDSDRIPRKPPRRSHGNRLEPNRLHCEEQVMLRPTALSDSTDLRRHDQTDSAVDHTPETPPPSFKPPAPPRTPCTDDKSGCRSQSPIILHSSGNGNFHHARGRMDSAHSTDDVDAECDHFARATLVAGATPLVAARLSLRKRPDSGSAPPSELSREGFVDAHRKAQNALRLAVEDQVTTQYGFTQISVPARHRSAGTQTVLFATSYVT